MASRDDTRKGRGWSVGWVVGGLLVLTAFLVYRYRAELFLFLAVGRADTEWARELERENNTGHEGAEGVVATGDGFSVVGETNSRRPGVHQAWVLRFEKAPPPRWERTHGGSTLGTGVIGRGIATVPGGGLVIAGEEQVSVGLFRGWLLALSSTGDVLWERTPGREGVNGFTAVCVLEDGSVVVGGNQEGAGWVMRLSSRGEVLWDVTLPLLKHVTDVLALPAQRIAVLGTAGSSTVGRGVSKLFLLESDGRATQEKRLPSEGWGELEAFTLLADGGLAATGRRGRLDSRDSGLWIVRMDSRGNVLWEYAPEGDLAERGHAITALPDGGVAVVGSTWKSGQLDREAMVWRLSAEGHLSWARPFGGAKDDWGEGIAHLADDSLVVVGTTMSKGAGKTDLWTFGLSLEGELLWEETFGSP